MEIGSFETTLIIAAILTAITWLNEVIKYFRCRGDTTKGQEITFSKFLILFILSLVCAKTISFTVWNLLPIAQGLTADEDIKIYLVLGGCVATLLTIYSLIRATEKEW